MKKPIVSIIMGSDSDLAIMSEAARILDEFKVPYEITVVSAHRSPKRMATYAATLSSRGIKAVIAGAGGAAHLPGVAAALTTVPVIGIPIMTRSFKGVDSLLSIVQMPLGVPVATVGINNAGNAALLAVRMLAVWDPRVQQLLEAYHESMEKKVQKKAASLKRLGYHAYLTSAPLKK